MDNKTQLSPALQIRSDQPINLAGGKQVIIRYRVHTENVAPALVSRHFEGFSIIPNVRGFYKGKGENAVIVEILGSIADGQKVRTLAQEIREQYRQQEVWITTEEVNLTRVTIDAVKDGF